MYDIFIYRKVNTQLITSWCLIIDNLAEIDVFVVVGFQLHALIAIKHH